MIHSNVVRKVKAAEIWNFPADSCKFLTEDVWGAQNFNFTSNSPERKIFSPGLYILKQKNF